MRRNKLEAIAVTAINIAELGIADADGILQHCVKHALQIAWRTADDLKNLRRGRLLL